MIQKNTWIYITILVLLAAFVWASQQPESPLSNLLKPEETPNQNQPEAFVPNGRNDFVEISLNSSSDGKVRLYWQEGVWYLEKDGTTNPAPPELVLAAIGQVSNLQIINHLADANLQETGLTSPKHSLVITFFDQSVQSLIIGNLTPINSGYYASPEQGQVVIIEKYGLEQLINLLISAISTTQPE